MDLNVRAFRTVQEALREHPPTEEVTKKAASRKGGLIGGRARAVAISAERRLEIAKKANKARWSKHRKVGECVINAGRFLDSEK
jgi:hypothetical protein